MAISFDALLKIKAGVQGEGAVQSLAGKLNGLQGAAARASAGFKGLAGSVGGLVPGIQSLIPLATGAGLTAMAASAINAADDLNDMRQKTGVSVEMLSQLQQAAEKSGTTIEGVSTALVRYNRGIVDGKADEALKSLGISATDASGRMKSADQVLLELADKFATMPDGAEKTAAAMKLFGRAGADMIPMLNGGSESIKGLAVTMTGEFASAADEFNDKMVDLRTGLARIGVGLGTALMPFLIATTDALTGMVSAFSALPGPLQTTIAAVAALGVGLVVLAPAIASIISIAGALAGLQIGATIAGWAGAVVPAIGAISAAFTGLLAFLTGTIGPGLLAFFSGPAGWTVLAVAAVVAMAVAFREPIMDFLKWAGSAFASVAQSFIDAVAVPISNTWKAVMEFLPKAMSAARDKVVSAWTSIVETIRNVFRSVMQFIANGINSLIDRVNYLIRGYNNIPVAFDIPTLGYVSVPKFAQGGYVTRRTLAEIGEGGEPEYVVPQSKAMRFANNIARGRSGMAALSAPPGRAMAGSAAGPSFTPLGPSGPIAINIQTGPVVEMNGQKYVSYDDLERAMRVTADGVIGRLRTPYARQALGR
jgi:hypothetical protein